METLNLHGMGLDEALQKDLQQHSVVFAARGGHIGHKSWQRPSQRKELFGHQIRGAQNAQNPPGNKSCRV